MRIGQDLNKFKFSNIFGILFIGIQFKVVSHITLSEFLNRLRRGLKDNL